MICGSCVFCTQNQEVFEMTNLPEPTRDMLSAISERTDLAERVAALEQRVRLLEEREPGRATQEQGVHRMITVFATPQPSHKQPARKDDLPIHVCPFTLAIDTREQAPWPFQGITINGREWIVKREIKTLHTGDYSIVNCEERIVIERKSPEDFVGTISSGNARFRSEHERMQEIVQAAPGNYCCVIVEGSMSAICDELDDPTNGRRVGSDVVIGWCASWPRRYGVPVLFAGDRRRAELLAFRLLVKWWDEVGKLSMERTTNGQDAT
jgi:ERCC4-type nuclease